MLHMHIPCPIVVVLVHCVCMRKLLPNQTTSPPNPLSLSLAQLASFEWSEEDCCNDQSVSEREGK